MASYTFRFPADLAGADVTVTDVKGGTVTTGTLDGAATFITSLPEGTYTGVAKRGSHSFSTAADGTSADPDDTEFARQLNDPASQTRAALSAAYARPRLLTAVTAGDSIAAHDAEGSSATYAQGTNASGFYAVANALLGRPLVFTANGAVPGERSDQTLARMDTILASSPGYLFLHVGINDVTQNKTLTDIQTSITGILDKARAAGAFVVVGTLLPYNSLTTGQNSVRRAVNEWLLNTVQRTRRNVVVFDGIRYVADPTTTGPSWVAAYSTDGLHPNSAGGFQLGLPLADLLATILPKGQPLNTHASDDTNLIAKGIPQGTAGQKDATVTGNVPDGAAIWKSTGTGAVTASMVTRTDGIQGSVSRAVMTAGNTGLYYWQWQVNPTVGTIIYGDVEVNLPGDWTVPKRLFAALEVYNGGTLLASSYDLRQVTADAAIGRNIARQGIRFRCPAITVPTGATMAQLKLFFQADSGTIDVAGAAVRTASAVGPI